MPTPDSTLEQLVADGVLEQRGERHRTTRRWQAAMARAAFRLVANDDHYDLRAPIVSALLELYGVDVSDEMLLAYVGVLTPIEEHELHPDVRS